MSARRVVTPTAERLGVENDAGDESAVSEELHRWVIELDNFERLLSIQEQLLADGSDIDETRTAQALFRPPTGLPPLPVQLVPWARALAERNDELLRRARVALAAQTPVVARPPTRSAVAPVGLDTLA